jgi:ribosome maturation factor RimP
MKPEIKVNIETKITELLDNEPSLFLISVKIDAKNNIKVFLDGDTGISIGQCTQVNRSLYKYIEESGFFPNDDFSLEVSSAGVDEPLALLRQYKKNISRNLEVLLTNGEKITGKLLDAEESHILLEITKGKGKKAEIKTEQIEIKDIKSAIVQIKF